MKRLALLIPLLAVVVGCASRPSSAPLAGTWDTATTVLDGVASSRLDLGTVHGDWSTARWAVRALPAPLDVRAWDGLEITIRTAHPRTDVGLDVGVMEADGSWYTVHDAIPLTTSERTVRIPFSALQHAEWVFDATGTTSGSDGNYDEDFRCDLSTIGRLAVGVVNGRGVGTVEFSVVDLRLARWLDQPATATSAEATVEVTGRRLRINDTDSVPPGIFGLHIVDPSGAARVRDLRVGSLRTCQALKWGTGFAKPPDPANGVDFYVTGLYDRKQQLPQVDDPAGWRSGAAATAAGILASVRAGNFADHALIEFWNEPYLDLGKMLDGRFTLPLDNPAGIHAGDAVRLDDQPLGSLTWVEGRELAVPGKPPRRLWPRQPAAPPWRTPEEKSGWDNGKPLLIGVDPTRTSYWSGRQIAEFYSVALLAVAEPVKAAEPAVRFIAGYGFRPCEDRWQAWRVLDQYTIDHTINVIDGYGEHHYQGYPEGIAASYDVLMGYTDTTYGKRLKSYNTEANDLWDSPARGGLLPSAQNTAEHVAARRLGYNLRDLLYVLRETPDKLVARAIHALWSSGVPLAPGMPATARELTLTLGAVSFFDLPPVGLAAPYPAGTFFLGVEVELVNSNSRARMELGAGLPHVPGVTASLVIAPDLLGEKTVIEPGATRHGRLVWALSAKPAADAVVTWNPDGFPRRWLLHGSLTAADLPPWEVIGINEGEYRCLQFLRNLRGPLVEVHSSDPGVWAVASIDATNHQLSMVTFRADGAGGQLTCTLTAPTGTTFGPGTRETLNVTRDGRISLDSTAEPAAGTTHVVHCDLPADGGLALTLLLTGIWPATAEVVHEQYFATGILNDLAPGASATLPVQLPANAATAKRAWLQVVVEELGPGEGVVEIDGAHLTLPTAWTPPNCPAIRRLELAPRLLTGLDHLTFSAAGPAVGNGFLLCAASIILER